MSTSIFPSNLDTYTNPTSTSSTNSPSLSAGQTLQNDSLVSVETKIGVDGSTVVTTLDYKLKNTASVDPGHTHTGASLAAGSVTATQLAANAVTGTAIATGSVGNTQLSISAIKLGYAQINSAFTTSVAATNVPVTGLSLTVTVPAGGRSVRLEVSGSYLQNTVLNNVSISLYEGSTPLAYSIATISATLNVVSCYVVSIVNPTPGSHTYIAQINQSSAGTITLGASTTAPAFILATLI